MKINCTEFEYTSFDQKWKYLLISKKICMQVPFNIIYEFILCRKCFNLNRLKLVNILFVLQKKLIVNGFYNLGVRATLTSTGFTRRLRSKKNVSHDHLIA